MKITAVQIDPPKLHKTIVASFSLDEIHTLCLDLALDFDELPPGGKSAKARGLLEMCQRQRRLVALAEAVLAQRPHISLNEFLRDIAHNDAPFKGMLAFEEADGAIFFGREALTAELVDRVVEPTSFLALVGASGSGKSSVVRAGMIPQLRRQTKWPIHLITPTAHPLQAQATSLTRDSESVTATATLMDDLRKEPRALHLYVARLLQEMQAQRLLLVIDQFEELFTLCKDEVERTAFVENLVEAIGEDNQITVLLTLRADFYHHCLQYKSLHHLLEQQQKIVPSMSNTELRAAIELPAQQANLTFEGGLVDILLRDVGAADNQTPEPGALPLLSHALLETWQRRDPTENRLTLAGYTEAGGVQGAIAKTAENTYQQLPADQQKIARSIFLRLTELGEGTQDTRRRAALAELLPQNDKRTNVVQVLKTLADARLLTTSDDGVEVAHEALIRQWPTLQNWLDEDREGLRLHRQLTEAAQAWAANEHEESYLFRGGRLEQIDAWVDKTDAPLNQLETEFLLASQELEVNVLAQAQAVATERTRASRFLRIALFVADLFAIAFLIFLLQTRENAINANRQRKVALAQSVAALANVVLAQDNDTELATLLAIQGAQLNWDVAGDADWLIDNNLRSYLSSQIIFNNTLRGHLSPVLSVEFSPDGHTLASGSDDQTIRLWDMSDPAVEPVVLWGHESSVSSVAFSPEGHTLASGSDDQTIRLWDMSDPAVEPVVLRGHESSVSSVAFSPDGHILASGSDDQTIRLWDMSDPAAEPVVLRGHESSVSSVAFSPDGHTLASGSDDQTIRLWDMSDPATEPVVLRRHNASVWSVAFSPDGGTLASGSDDGTIWLWDMRDLESEPIVLQGHEASVWSVMFSPDGGALASGGVDNTIRLWNLKDLAVEPIVLLGHERDARSVVFSPENGSLASGSDDATIRLWNLEDPEVESTFLQGHEGWVRSVAFSPDEKVLASGSDDATIRLWDLRDLEAGPVVLQGHEASVLSVAFSPDGGILASGSDDATIRLWDLRDLEAEPVVLQGHEASVLSVAFAPDGGILASGGADAMIRLWDLRDLGAEPIVLQEHEASVLSVAFSPDGGTLASGSDDGTIRLWDMEDTIIESKVLPELNFAVMSIAYSPEGEILAGGSIDNVIRLWSLSNLTSQPMVLRAHEFFVTSVAFSQDGDILASSSVDHTIRLWNLTNLDAKPTVLRSSGSAVLSLAFSPQGHTLASSGEGVAIRLWIWRLEELVEIGCQKVRRNLSWEEWQRYLPGEPYRQTCPNLPPHPSVPVEELQ